MMPSQFLFLSLMLDLLSYHQLLPPLSFGLYQLQLYLSLSIFSQSQDLFISGLVFLKFAIFLQMQLLHQTVLHLFALFVLSPLVLILSSKKGQSSIISSIYEMIKPFSTFLIKILKISTIFTLNVNLLPIFRQVLQWQKRVLQSRRRRISINQTIILLCDRQSLKIVSFLEPFFLLELDSLLKLIMIDGLKCILVIQAWILIDLDGLNDPWINLLSKLLAMMLLIGKIHPIDLFHQLYSIGRIEKIWNKTSRL